MPRRFIHSIVNRRSSSTDRSSPLRADSAWRRNWITETPGISCGYWNARNIPALARTSVGHSVTSSPWKKIRPPVTAYSGEPSSVLASVLLPEPFGPMIAWTSPAFTVSETPRRMSVPTPSGGSAGRADRSSIRNSSLTASSVFPLSRVVETLVVVGVVRDRAGLAWVPGPANPSAWRLTLLTGLALFERGVPLGHPRRVTVPVNGRSSDGRFVPSHRGQDSGCSVGRRCVVGRGGGRWRCHHRPRRSTTVGAVSATTRRRRAAPSTQTLARPSVATRSTTALRRRRQPRSGRERRTSRSRRPRPRHPRGPRRHDPRAAGVVRPQGHRRRWRSRHRRRRSRVQPHRRQRHRRHVHHAVADRPDPPVHRDAQPRPRRDRSQHGRSPRSARRQRVAVQLRRQRSTSSPTSSAGSRRPPTTRR